MPSERFNEIARKLRRLERMMGGLADDAERKASLFGDDGAASPAGASHDEGAAGINASPRAGALKFDHESLAKLLLRLKQCRQVHMDDELFGNVSWDMLLTIFLEKNRQGSAIRSKVAILGANCPPTTGLRWLSLLEEEGLIRRFGADDDLRARLVELTDSGDQIMREYLDAAGSAIYETFVEMQVDASIQLETFQ